MSWSRVSEADLDSHSLGLNLISDEIHSIRLYQADQDLSTLAGTRRWHEWINLFLRDGLPDSLDDRTSRNIARVVNHLQSAVGKSTLPFSVRAWRGVRQPGRISDFEAMLRINGPVEGELLTLNGMVSCSLSRETAIQFGSPAPTLLLELEIDAGMNALWVPPWGTPRMRGQKELVLDDGTQVLLKAVVPESEELTTVVCEVVQ